MQLEGPHLEAATAARTPLLLNSAACELRRQNWHAAIAHCQEVCTAPAALAPFHGGRSRASIGGATTPH